MHNVLRVKHFVSFFRKMWTIHKNYAILQVLHILILTTSSLRLVKTQALVTILEVGIKCVAALTKLRFSCVGFGWRIFHLWGDYISCDKYTKEIKELLKGVIDMTETIKIIHNDLSTENKNKVNSLINVLAVYGKEIDKKARIMQLNILRDEAENESFEINYDR